MIFEDVRKLAIDASKGEFSSTKEMISLKMEASRDVNMAYDVLTGLEGGGELRRGVDLSIWRDYHLPDTKQEKTTPGSFAPWLSSKEAANIKSGIEAAYQLSAENVIYAGHELVKLWKSLTIDEVRLQAYKNATRLDQLFLWKYIDKFGDKNLEDSIKSIEKSGLKSRYALDKNPDSRFRYEDVGKDPSPTTSLDILVKRDVHFNFFFVESEEAAKNLSAGHAKTYGGATYKFDPQKVGLFKYGCIELHDLVTPELNDDKKGSRLPGRTSSTTFDRTLRDQVKNEETALSVSARVSTVAGDLGHQVRYGTTDKQWFAREDILFGPHIPFGITVKAWLELARLLTYDRKSGLDVLEKAKKDPVAVMGWLFRIQALIPGNISLSLGTRQ